MKIRIFALSRELGLDSKVLLGLCDEAGVPLRNALATITPEERDHIVEYINRKEGRSSRGVGLLPPPSNAQAVKELQAVGKLENATAHPASVTAWKDFDPQRISAAAFESKGIVIPKKTLAGISNSLLQRRHLLLWGPPGTGKTEIAKALPELLFEKKHPFLLATANASWTSYHVIGGPEMHEGNMRFRPGVFTSAVKKAGKTGQYWLILDEINRADIDRAIGEMFTALEDSVLRIHKGNGKEEVLKVHPRFRVIATMNTADKNNLFPLSLALMRRFAMIEVPPITDTVQQDNLLQEKLREFAAAVYKNGGEAFDELAKSERFTSLRDTLLATFHALRAQAVRPDGVTAPELFVGTSIVLEVLKYLVVAGLQGGGAALTDEVADQALMASYILQLEALDVHELEAVSSTLKDSGLDLPKVRQLIENWIARQSLSI